MIYRKLGKSGLEVSAIGLGSWEMAGNVWGNADEANSIRTIHEAVECGINLLDTAASYGGGRAETVVGKALKGIRKGDSVHQMRSESAAEQRRRIQPHA